MPSSSTRLPDKCPLPSCGISFRKYEERFKAELISEHNDFFHWLVYCAPCGELFDSPADLTAHSDTHHPFCLLCRRSFHSAAEREAHFVKNHQAVYCSECSHRRGDGIRCLCDVAKEINESLRKSGKSGHRSRDEGDFHPDKFHHSAGINSSYRGSSTGEYHTYYSSFGAGDSYKSNWDYRDPSSKSKTKDSKSHHHGDSRHHGHSHHHPRSHHHGHSHSYEYTSGGYKYYTSTSYKYTNTGYDGARDSHDPSSSSDDDHPSGSYHRPSSTRSAPKPKAHDRGSSSNTGSSSSKPKPSDHSRSSSSSKPKPSEHPPTSTTPPTQDYYTLINIPPTATHDETLKAIKKARIANHPDRFMNKNLPPAELEKIVEKSKCIGQACDVLEDPSARRAYDAKLQRDRLYSRGSSARYESRYKPSSSSSSSRAGGSHSKPSSSSSGNGSHYEGYKSGFGNAGSKAGGKGSPLRNEYKPGSSRSSSGSSSRREGGSKKGSSGGEGGRRHHHHHHHSGRRLSDVDEEMTDV
ncbi:MAG: hypothetical protein HETSPECPRED_006734 [Heterodermia speciosa]|uniref:J domain-containing protein n=1 Tax=Heterodermia speciosa TaxID=116794 RepID=A0A8H3FRG7_9LECA|nr:MAG: hypothetical protein HETSPECPRED_006734 [Heterodermia speciosa]